MDKIRVSTISNQNYFTNFGTNTNENLSESTITEEIKKPKISSLFSEYCDSSSIHGIRYIGHFERPLYERLFWLLIIILCIYGSIKLSLDVYDKWENHPVIVSFEDTSTPINKIPFPAVTICPGIKVKSKDFNFTRINSAIEGGEIKYDGYDIGLNDEEFDILESLRNVKGCDVTFENKTVYKKMNKTIVQTLLNIAPTFNDIFHECWWEDRKIDCKQIWKRTLTLDGICYTFNSLGNKNIYTKNALHQPNTVGQFAPNYINWNSETGYTENPCNNENYPRKVITAGFEVGLYVELKGSSDDFDENCGGNFPGFKMMVHAPNELADAEKNFVRIPFNNEILAAVRPSMRNTSFDLRDMPHKKRQCFFESEKSLQFFNSYNEVNCLLECQANYSLTICGCSEFFSPKTNDTRVCTQNDKACLLKAFEELLSNETGVGVCHCLPACTAINYNLEISSSTIAQNRTDNINQTITSSAVEKDQNLEYATLTVFYKEDQFWSAKRSALFGRTEVLANCGGILGLFLGISVLSIIEILYFLTFRLIRFYVENKKREDDVFEEIQ